MLQTRVRQRFVTWLCRGFATQLIKEFVQHPLCFFFCGTWLYSQGEPMHVFRHLVVFLQQLFPTCRHFCADAWDLLNGKIVQLGPLPKLVLNACSLGLQWGWRRWCAISFSFSRCYADRKSIQSPQIKLGVFL